MFIKALLVAIVATLSNGWIFHPITWPMIYPLFSGFIVALILGDPIQGMAAAAYINLAYLGWITAGGAMPGNIMAAGVYGTALTILAGADPKLPVSFAIPLSLIGILLWQLQMTVNAIWVHRADKAAEEANIRGVYLATYLYPQITVFLIYGVPAFLMVYFGSDYFMHMLKLIPQSLADALTVVGGLMPALGIGMLLNFLAKPKMMPLFFIGFLAATYLGLDLMAIALFGAFIALYYYMSQPGEISFGEDQQDETSHYGKKLTKQDLIVHWLRGLSQECAYNFERLQATGACAAMVPIIKRLYTTKEDIRDALKRYLVFFNTEPGFIGPMIPGIVASMEEQRANGAPITDEDINSLRTGLMGPLAGIGDTVSQGILYPTAVALAAGMALDGNVFGPIFFFLVFSGCMLLLGYNMYMLGYRKGKSAVVSLLKSNLMSRVTGAFAILGLMVVGAMGAQRVLIDVPLKLSMGESTIVVQDILNSLMPNLVPLTIILITWQLVQKKKSPLAIVLGMFVVGIACSYLGILGAVQ
jgi:PTS system mannose-specific IID component